MEKINQLNDKIQKVINNNIIFFLLCYLKQKYIIFKEITKKILVYLGF